MSLCGEGWEGEEAGLPEVAKGAASYILSSLITEGFQGHGGMGGDPDGLTLVKSRAPSGEVGLPKGIVDGAGEGRCGPASGGCVEAGLAPTQGQLCPLVGLLQEGTSLPTTGHMREKGEWDAKGLSAAIRSDYGVPDTRRLDASKPLGPLPKTRLHSRAHGVD